MYTNSVLDFDLENLHVLEFGLKKKYHVHAYDYWKYSSFLLKILEFSFELTEIVFISDSDICNTLKINK